MGLFSVPALHLRAALARAEVQFWKLLPEHLQSSPTSQRYPRAFVNLSSCDEGASLGFFFFRGFGVFLSDIDG